MKPEDPAVIDLADIFDRVTETTGETSYVLLATDFFAFVLAVFTAPF